MKKKNTITLTGNEKSGKINLYDDTFFPKISKLVGSLGEREKLAIIALVEKDPSEKWDDVAKRVGITTRQLFNIRQHPNVQEACYTISKELFKSDVPDVLKTLSKKAKAGEAWAVRLFLEVAGELKDKDQGFPNSDGNFNWTEKAKQFLEEFKNKPLEEQMNDLEQRLKLSARGVEDTFKAVYQQGD